MANHKSAQKRARQNEIKRLRNKALKTRVKNVIKSFRSSLGSKSGTKDVGKIIEALRIAKSVIDRASNKGTLHRKTASRKISRLSKLANAIGNV